MANCEYIFRCDSERKGLDPMCKNNHVASHCWYWQGLFVEDHRDSSEDSVEKNISGLAANVISFGDNFYK